MKIDEMTFMTRTKSAPHQWVFFCDRSRWTSDGWSHTAYRITLRDGSKWALDLTTAQFGYEDNLVPWQQYEQERIIHFLEVDDFGGTSAKSKRDLSLAPGSDTIFFDELAKHIFQVQREIGMMMEVIVAVAFKKMGVIADKFLESLSDDEFTRRVGILGASKVGMEAFKEMRKLDEEAG